jgi:hypothetical protein
MEASLKVRTIATHPLIIEQNQKVLEKNKGKAPQAFDKDDVGKKQFKKEMIKIEKQQRQAKCENYISNSMNKK